MRACIRIPKTKTPSTPSELDGRKMRQRIGLCDPYFQFRTNLFFIRRCRDWQSLEKKELVSLDGAEALRVEQRKLILSLLYLLAEKPTGESVAHLVLFAESLREYVDSSQEAIDDELTHFEGASGRFGNVSTLDNLETSFRRQALERFVAVSAFREDASVVVGHEIVAHDQMTIGLQGLASYLEESIHRNVLSGFAHDDAIVASFLGFELLELGVMERCLQLFSEHLLLISIRRKSFDRIASFLQADAHLAGSATNIQNALATFGDAIDQQIFVALLRFFQSVEREFVAVVPDAVVESFKSEYVAIKSQGAIIARLVGGGLRHAFFVGGNV